MREVILNMLLWISAVCLIVESSSLYSEVASIKATIGNINITCNDSYSINITGLYIEQHGTCPGTNNHSCIISDSDLQGISTRCNKKKTCSYEFLDIKDCNYTEILSYKVSYGCLEGSNIGMNSYCRTIKPEDTLSCTNTHITTVTNVNLLTAASHCNECKCESLRNEILEKIRRKCINITQCGLDFKEEAIKYGCIYMPTYIKVAFICLSQEDYGELQATTIVAENTMEKDTTENNTSTDYKGTDYVIPAVSCVGALLLGIVLLICTVKLADRCKTMNRDYQTTVLVDSNSSHAVNTIWNQGLPFANSQSSTENYFEEINLAVNNDSVLNGTFVTFQHQRISPNLGLHKSVKPFTQSNNEAENVNLVNDQIIKHPQIKVLELPELTRYEGINKYAKIKQEVKHFDLINEEAMANPPSQIRHYSLALPEQTIKQEMENDDLLHEQEMKCPSFDVRHYSMALPFPRPDTEINPYAQSTIGILDDHNENISKVHRPDVSVCDPDGYVTLNTSVNANKITLECEQVNDFQQIYDSINVNEDTYDHANKKRCEAITANADEVYNHLMDNMYDTTDKQKHEKRKVDMYDHVNICN